MSLPIIICSLPCSATWFGVDGGGGEGIDLTTLDIAREGAQYASTGAYFAWNNKEQDND
jgi:hypothetical protein